MLRRHHILACISIILCLNLLTFPHADAASAIVTSSTPHTQTSTPKTCCRICTKGKPCGDACIAPGDVCHLKTGCACSSRSCCKQCKPGVSQPCGNACIPLDKTCRKKPGEGCACSMADDSTPPSGPTPPKSDSLDDEKRKDQKEDKLTGDRFIIKTPTTTNSKPKSDENSQHKYEYTKDQAPPDPTRVLLDALRDRDKQTGQMDEDSSGFIAQFTKTLADLIEDWKESKLADGEHVIDIDEQPRRFKTKKGKKQKMKKNKKRQQQNGQNGQGAKDAQVPSKNDPKPHKTEL